MRMPIQISNCGSPTSEDIGKLPQPETWQETIKSQVPQRLSPKPLMKRLDASSA